MLKESQLHAYQLRIRDFILERAYAALLVDLGLGKSVSVLSALVVLRNFGRLFGTLILAPVRVVENVWAQEVAKWEHTAHLRVCILRGSKPAMARNLLRRYDIYVINYESLPWLATQLNTLFLGRGRYPPFNCLVLDEMTRVKDLTGRRVSFLHPFLPYFEYRIGLTGTPAPNGYADLLGQYYCLDGGYRLGSDKKVFKERFFVEDAYSRKVVPTKEGKIQIEQLVADISISMRSEDYLELPPYIYNDLEVDLPEDVREQYEEFESTMFAELDHGIVEVYNAASLTMKCRQLANGIYLDNETAQAHPVHDAKLEALDSVVEESAGQPILCAYLFRADMERIRRRYERRYRVAYLGPGVGMADGQKIISEWNRGHYDMLLMHPASGAHGINLQGGGHQIVWFGLDWNLEHWIQLNARLRRQGQRAQHVIVHRILARSTIDEAVKTALDRKTNDQEGLRRAIEEYRKEKRG